MRSRAADRRGRARLWSAAAATVEEPYSLAMALIEVFRRDDPPATILATDINEEALAVARQGEYGEAALGALTRERRARFFSETTGTTRSQLAPAVQRLVEFRALNLIDPIWPIEGPFDVIFCRNVLMYLEAGCRQSVLERMASRLAPGGLLVLDPVEHLGGAGHLFASGKNGIYSPRSPSLTSATDDRFPARQLTIQNL
jgi:chemotaxis protein methyltransferase CheR